uniref:N-alpha-acetyltransferase 35 NatC auxiliary subunit-like isoform X1 n=1 Tax=Rhizophora mucronata TaxID=61149 RepID=A0A2P2LNF6_RHIMU
MSHSTDTRPFFFSRDLCSILIFYKKPVFLTMFHIHHSRNQPQMFASQLQLHIITSKML